MKIITMYRTVMKIPENSSVEKKNNFLIFYGPLGFSTVNLFKFDQKGDVALFLDKKKKIISIKTVNQPLFRGLEKLIKNKINGVSKGFLVYLRVVGIGYRVTIKESRLQLKLGFSHDLLFKIPDSVRIFLIEPTLICLLGLDKNQITQIAAKIRQIRPPSPYKGKGIRFLNERIFIKQGKQKQK